MLFDPKWDQQTKADPFKLEGLISWLETQPKDKKYDFMNCEGACLYGQYMASVGVPWKQAGACSVYYAGDKHKSFREGVVYPIAGEGTETFGAALGRARAALSSQERGEK